VGLFTGILRTIGGPIVNSIFGAHDNKKAISGARDATLAGINNAKGDLSSQLAASQGRLDPYESAGTDALSQIRGILGLNGADAQSAGIAGIQNSPLFKSLMQGGQDILLNNASATGGLRGGNFEHDLANFSTDTLAQTIQQMIGNWGGLTQQGLGATEYGAGLGAQNAGHLADLDTGAGSANAGAILGKTAVTNNMFDQIQKIIQSAASGGAGGGFNLGSLFNGGGGGGGIPSFPKINIALPSSSAGLPGF
jgi:hypothetical protein